MIGDLTIVPWRKDPLTDAQLSLTSNYAGAEADRIRQSAPLLPQDAAALAEGIKRCGAVGLRVRVADIGVADSRRLTCTLVLQLSEPLTGKAKQQALDYVRQQIAGGNANWKVRPGTELQFVTVSWIPWLWGAQSPSPDFFMFYRLSRGPYVYSAALPILAAIETMNNADGRHQMSEELYSLSDKVVPGLRDRMRARWVEEVKKKSEEIAKQLKEQLEKIDTLNDVVGEITGDLNKMRKEFEEKRDKFKRSLESSVIDDLKNGKYGWGTAASLFQDTQDNIVSAKSQFRRDSQTTISRYFADHAENLEDDIKRLGEKILHDLRNSDLYREVRGMGKWALEPIKKAYAVDLKNGISQLYASMMQRASLIWEKYARNFSDLKQGLHFLTESVKWLSRALDLFEVLFAKGWREKFDAIVKLSITFVVQRAAAVVAEWVGMAVVVVLEAMGIVVGSITGIGILILVGLAVGFFASLMSDFLVKYFEEIFDEYVVKNENISNAVENLNPRYYFYTHQPWSPYS